MKFIIVIVIRFCNYSSDFFSKKLTEYVVLFSRQISTYWLAIFDGIFEVSFKRFYCSELKFEKIFHL